METFTNCHQPALNCAAQIRSSLWALALALDLVSALAVDRIVPEVKSRTNACGGGAIAAMLSAVRELGATRAEVLRHANSFETLAGVAPQRPVDAVGYAAVVVG